MLTLISKVTIIGIIILIAVVSISIATCFYIASRVDNNNNNEEK